MGSCQFRLNPFLSASTAFAIWLIYGIGPLDHCQDRSVLVAISSGRRVLASSTLENIFKSAMSRYGPRSASSEEVRSFACVVNYLMRISTILVPFIVLYFLQVS
jgi:hypothetical protein